MSAWIMPTLGAQKNKDLSLFLSLCPLSSLVSLLPLLYLKKEKNKDMQNYLISNHQAPQGLMGTKKKHLASEIECNRGVVAKDTATIATPEGMEAFFARDAKDAIEHASVAGMVATADCHVALLCLQQELGPLDRCHNSVRNTTHHSACHQISWKIGPCLCWPIC